MGLIKRMLEKYNPSLLKYEFFIRLIIDMLFFVVLILIMIRAAPQIIYYCNVTDFVDTRNVTILVNYTNITHP